MWRYVDTNHALNAIKGKKVKFSFAFDPAVTIVNGGFEESDMSYWVTGGAGDHSRSWKEYHSGNFSMLIGYNYSAPVADSADWCYQNITIPLTAKNTILTFWYRLYTEDSVNWNWFEVDVRDSSGNILEQIFKKGGVDYPGLEVYGWEQVTFNLTKYAGQTIQIYFAVNNTFDTKFKTWCYIDDVAINNEARAEIYYEYTTSGGGGGCPYVYTWDGCRYILDNNVIPNSENSSRDVVDYYLLQQPLISDNGQYRLMLSEFEEEHSYFDQVKLITVDHPANVSVAVSSYGEILTYTNPHPPVSAITNEKKNVKELLSSIDGNYYESYNGSYVVLNFGDELNASQGAKLIVRADVKAVLTSVYVQVKSSDGAWNTVATIIPKANWATEIVDLSHYLPDANGDLKVRLYFTARHKIDFVGLDTSPQTTIKIQEALLASAKQSKNGDPTVCNGTLESDVKSKLLYNDGDYVGLMPHERIELAFASLETPTVGLKRDFIFISKGHYRTLPAGTLIDPTVSGYWIAPTSYDWHTAEVIVALPSTTTSVKVIIHGRTDFQACIDNAIFTITDNKTLTTDYGVLSVSLDVISWRQEPGTYGSVVRAAVGLAAYPKKPYQIRSIRLEAELLPNSQDGKLNITYACQANDKGHEVDPTQVKGYRYFATNILASALGKAASTVVRLVILKFLPKLEPFRIDAFVGEATSSFVKDRLKGWASEPENRLAGVGYESSKVWEQWDYPTFYKEYQPDQFVSMHRCGEGK
jgi:hypothetical protein